MMMRMKFGPSTVKQFPCIVYTFRALFMWYTYLYVEKETMSQREKYYGITRNVHITPCDTKSSITIVPAYSYLLKIITHFE